MRRRFVWIVYYSERLNCFRNVCPRYNELHIGPILSRVHVNRQNPRVRIRAAQEGGLEQARRMMIVDIRALAGQQTAIFPPLHPCAN